MENKKYYEFDDALNENCGRYYSLSQLPGTNKYILEFPDFMYNDVVYIVDYFDYKIVEESDFTGSNWDGISLILEDNTF